MGSNRRDFLKMLLAAGVSAGVMRPRLTFAANPVNGRIKNFVHVFLYGGCDGRYAYPMISGPVADIIRAGRPNVGQPDANQVLLPNGGLAQNGRANSVGFHPALIELVKALNDTACGAAIFTEYGITPGGSYSHEIAAGQFQIGSYLSPNVYRQGWMSRLIDSAGMQAMTVWGVNEGSERYFNAESASPLRIASYGQYRSPLAMFQNSDRDFGTFKGFTDGQRDSAFMREIAQKLANEPHPEISFDKALTGVAGDIYPTVGLVQKIGTQTGLPTNYYDTYLPPQANYWQHEFAAGMGDVGKLIRYTSSSSVSAEVRNSAKIFCTAMAGWDAHANISGSYDYNLKVLAGALQGLVRWLKTWGLLDSTVIQVHSEFGRTTRLNSSSGLDHGAANHSLVLGGKVMRTVLGPDPSVREANEQNTFTPQLSFTGVIKQILRAQGFTDDQLAAAFPVSMPGETGFNFIS